MSLRPTLMNDLKAAMKAGDTTTRDTLRMLKTDLDRAEMEKGSDLDESEELAVVMRAVKTRKEAAGQYEEGGRQDLVDKELAEVAVLDRFMPKAMSEDEVRSAMEAIAKELGVSEKRQMGQLIKETMSRHQGQIDGKTASRIAGTLLS